MQGVTGVRHRMRAFFFERVWETPPGHLDRGHAFGYRLARIVSAVYQGFLEKRLTFRAAALTYFSALSVVPFLAFAFSVIKGFGAYRRLVNDSLDPYLRATFGGNPALMTAIERLLRFVENTQVSSLGAFGIVFLLYSSIGLLSTIETALNDLWGAASGRPFVRRLTDYTTLLVVTPLLVLTAVTFATAAQSSHVVLLLRQNLHLGFVIDFSLKLTSLLLGSAAMIALYLLMPNVHTRARSAIIGGVIGGILWQLALVLYVRLQSGVASYNALYAGFAAVPIFLVWMYVSWLIVLSGGLIAAVHQHEKSMRHALTAAKIDASLSETLAVAIAAYATRRFFDGALPLTEEELVAAFGVPPQALERPLRGLIRAGVLVTTGSTGPDPGYALARDPDTVRSSQLRQAVRCNPAADEIRRTVSDSLGRPLRDLLGAEDDARAHCGPNPTLRELAAAVGRPPQREA
jgi:membrane protein